MNYEAYRITNGNITFIARERGFKAALARVPNGEGLILEKQRRRSTPCDGC